MEQDSAPEAESFEESAESTAEAALPDVSDEPSKAPEPRATAASPRRETPRPPVSRHEPRPPTQAQVTSAIAEAIEDVYNITEVLKKVLEDLDELLETLELAERQKIEDERELDNLRRAIRQLQQRPAQPQPRPAQHPGGRQSGRSHERQPQGHRPPPPARQEIKEQPPAAEPDQSKT